MGKRKLFLLFLSAMSVSIIIMVIIYGLFIKDFDFTFDVRNPETAPSPIDAFQASESNYVEEEKPGAAARVKTPDEEQAKEAAKTEESREKRQEAQEPQQQEETITDVIPLEPQVDPATEPMVPVPADPRQNEDGGSNEAVDAGPSLHYVYLDGFSSKNAAEHAIQQLQDRNLAARPYIRQHRGEIILQFGVFGDRANAKAMADKLRSQNVFVKVD